VVSPRRHFFSAISARSAVKRSSDRPDHRRGTRRGKVQSPECRVAVSHGRDPVETCLPSAISARSAVKCSSDRTDYRRGTRRGKVQSPECRVAVSHGRDPVETCLPSAISARSAVKRSSAGTDYRRGRRGRREERLRTGRDDLSQSAGAYDRRPVGCTCGHLLPLAVLNLSALSALCGETQLGRKRVPQRTQREAEGRSRNRGTISGKARARNVRRPHGMHTRSATIFASLQPLRSPRALR
jgi:hypothetical protein